MIEYPKDLVVERVLNLVKDRADIGMVKYGVSMMRPDLTTVEWLKHAREEALDLAVYLTRIIHDMEQMQDDHR